jgi:hypothetical protein
MINLKDSDFDTGPAKVVVDKGFYRLRVIGEASLTTSKAGTRKLLVPMVAYETADGQTVNSKVIKHKITLEGSEKAEQVGSEQFASLFSALGFSTDATKAIATGLTENLPDAATIQAGQYGQISANLSVNGDPVSIKKRTLMGSLKVESYEGTDYNRVSSLWAEKEGA